MPLIGCLSAWEEDASPSRDLRVSSLAILLLSQTLDDWRAAGSVPRPMKLATSRDRFTGLVIFLSQNLHRKITRDDLAAFTHLGPNSLDRAFRAVYGVAPMRMLRDLRLQRARHLLQCTPDTLDAVAQACGFEDAAYFSRVFRQRRGGRRGSTGGGGVESAGFGSFCLLPHPCGWTS